MTKEQFDKLVDELGISSFPLTFEIYGGSEVVPTQIRRILLSPPHANPWVIYCNAKFEEMLDEAIANCLKENSKK